MSGNKAGGKKTAATIKEKYGPEFYAKIGQKGGQNSNTGGFASQKIGRDGLTGRERASKMGAIGGSISKRGPVVKELTEKDLKPRVKKTTTKKKAEESKEHWWNFIVGKK